MTQEQLKTFLEKAKSDHSLQEKLRTAPDSDAVEAIANAAGIVISADEPKKVQVDVSSEELEGVSGAFQIYTQKNVLGCAPQTFDVAHGCYD